MITVAPTFQIVTEQASKSVKSPHKRTPSDGEKTVSSVSSDECTSEDFSSEDFSASPTELSEGSTIRGVGREFNKALGSTAFRTACSITVGASLENTLATLRRNLTEALADPTATCRLWVQNDQYWYSDLNADELVEMIVLVDETNSGLARTQRYRDGRGTDAVPVAVCVCEPHPSGDGTCLATWLFRHDVIDGWRVLRYLCSLLLETCDLTLERLRQRHKLKVQQAKSSAPPVKMIRSAAKVAAATALTPLAAGRLAQLARYGSSTDVGPRRQFYMHATVSLAAIKKLSAAHTLGPVTTTLTACIAAAFFAADPSRARAVVGSNVLLDPDAPEGNHVAVKMATLKRRGSEDGTLAAAARTINARSQALADLAVASFTCKYVRGQLSQRTEESIARRHQAMDFLVSNLPAFDVARPQVLGLQTSRDFVNWAPSIVYVIGVEDALYCDFYWGVRDGFDTDVFMHTFAALTGATEVHNTLPACY